MTWHQLYTYINYFLIVCLCVICIVAGYITGYFVRGTYTVLMINNIAMTKEHHTPAHGALLCTQDLLQQRLFDLSPLDKDENLYFKQYDQCLREYKHNHEIEE